MKYQTFTADEILNFVETWLITGNLNESMLAENFQFSSPFWQGANKPEFLKQFSNPKSYQEAVLSKITHFDPVIKLKGAGDRYIAVVLQYHTKNGNHVYETVLGTLISGLLVELRSIYDLDETKKSLELK